jgi:hypothetical protein
MMKSPEELAEDRETKLATEEQSAELTPLTVIHLDVTDARGKRYFGDFTFKVPTIGEQIEIGRRKIEQLPIGAAADPVAGILVEATCYLSVTIQKKPDWWKPWEFYDSLPLMALYKEARDYAGRFLGEAARPKANPREDSKPQNGAGSADHDQADVGREVPPASQRRETIIAHSARGS